MKNIQSVMSDNGGQAPGFFFLRHALAIIIIIFHSYAIVVGLNINAAEHKGAVAAYTSQLTMAQFVVELLRPGLFSLVGAFFVLSGFLVFGSAVRVRDVKPFLALRLLRIAPALMTEVTLSALVLGPLVTTLSLGLYFSDPKFWTYFLNIVGMVHFELPGVFQTNPFPNIVNINLWTLPPEFYCYALLAVLMWMFRNRLPLAAIIAAMGGFVWFGVGELVFDVPVRANTTRYTVSYIVYLFALGAAFMALSSRVRFSLPFFVAAVISYYALTLFRISDVAASIPLAYVTVYLGCCSFRWFDNMLKSDLSYGLYLYGFPISQALMFVLMPHMQGLGAVSRVAVIASLSIILTLLFAKLSWMFVEKPFLRFRKHFN